MIDAGEAEVKTSPIVCVAMSLLAGLSTTLGAGVVFLLPGQRVTPEQMSFALALAGGVMLSVTILEFWIPMIIGGKDKGPVVLFSLLGAAAFWGLSRFVPEPEVVPGVPHSHAGIEADKGEEIQDDEECQVIGRPHPHPEKLSDPEINDNTSTVKSRSARLAFVMMLSLTAHNFPEGFAVAVSASQSNRLGLVVMVAIAVHNIPEGIAIAVPVLVATGSRMRALWMSFLSGMAEPVGALTALLVLHGFGGTISEQSMDNLLCAVGGVMCAVSLQELLPEAVRQGTPCTVFVGIALGFLLMWLTIKLGA